ncbi:unnamed protein product [Dibothriocephalus latus]|uniref:Uncharacterized protein n=1 Tax=Dibothriocephalus latus TaxID=60516 RepID=A0A3P7KZB1_DIBLA|nr:unnamed protein product [Dibothriocephalus latus]
MRVCLLVLFALVAVALAADDDEKSSKNLRVEVMKRVVAVQKFFKEDPLGVKIGEQMVDLLEILKQGKCTCFLTNSYHMLLFESRLRLRKRLADYLTKLEA